MAKRKSRKSSKAKNYNIKWRKEDEKVLRESISNFNKNIRKLRKQRVSTDFLPSEIDYKGTRELIKNRSEFNRVIKSLSRFKGQQAYKKVTLPSGIEMTAWEKRELSYQKGVAKRRLQKMLKKEYRKYYKGQTNIYNEIKTSLESLDELYYVTGKKFENIKHRVENYGSQDYELRIAETYKENYLTMLSKRYSQLEGYEQLKEKIQSMNALEFYAKLDKMEQGAYIKDIRYMYDTKSYQAKFNLILKEFNVEVEDSEIKEGE